MIPRQRNDGNYDDTDESEYDENDDADEPTQAINKHILQVDDNASFSSDSSIHSENQNPVHTTNKNSNIESNIKFGPHNLQTIKRSDKFAHTLHLPKLCNINPQSVYNKKDEYKTFVDQMECDVIFMS